MVKIDHSWVPALNKVAKNWSGVWSTNRSDVNTSTSWAGSVMLSRFTGRRRLCLRPVRWGRVAVDRGIPLSPAATRVPTVAVVNST